MGEMRALPARNVQTIANRWMGKSGTTSKGLTAIKLYHI